LGDKHADKIADNWDREWKREKGRGKGPAGGRIKRLLRGSALTRSVCSVLVRESGCRVAGKRMLEAGCGTSNIAVELASDGALCYQFDISPTALDISRETFAKRGSRGFLVRGDLFSLPFEDKSLDIVWNVGVLEHLTPELQDRALSEMLRVCKVGGKVVTLNPYARGYIYCLGKWLAEKTGRWPLGYEVPILTLAPNLKRVAPDSVVREFSFGFLLQFLVFKHLIRDNRLLLTVYTAIYELANLVLSPLNRLPGFLLVTVIERKAG
jgi:ubiquinone/menaquinone biosynthesis C-methylase UbiE